MEELNTAGFIADLKAGNAKSFEILFDRLVGPLRSFIRSYYDVTEPDADEIVADALFKVHDAIKRFKSGQGAKLTTWIFEIARHTAIDYLRKERRRAVQLTEIGAAVAATHDQKKRLVHSAEPQDGRNLQRIRHALDELTEQDRNILLLRQTMSYEEIAEAEGTSAGTLRTRYFRALGRLEELYKKMQDQ